MVPAVDESQDGVNDAKANPGRDQECEKVYPRFPPLSLCSFFPLYFCLCLFQSLLSAIFVLFYAALLTLTLSLYGTHIHTQTNTRDCSLPTPTPTRLAIKCITIASVCSAISWSSMKCRKLFLSRPNVLAYCCLAVRYGVLGQRL